MIITDERKGRHVKLVSDNSGAISRMLQGQFSLLVLMSNRNLAPCLSNFWAYFLFCLRRV